MGIYITYFFMIMLIACAGVQDESIHITPSDLQTTTRDSIFLTAFRKEIKDEMKLITGEAYVPLYGKDSALVFVQDFLMDEYPVTNAQYLPFVLNVPRWRKSLVKEIFADDHYLTFWISDTTFQEDVLVKAPVTTVSWFAARAYCECLGKRLPTIDEWEYVAMANETMADARRLDSYNQYILEQYEKPESYRKKVGQSFKNYWGIYDLHGLVWEWTEDFNTVMITGESRKDGANDPNLFCGSGPLGSSDLMNYAAFMRYAFRGSLKANYSIRNLGFRCANDTTTNHGTQ